MPKFIVVKDTGWVCPVGDVVLVEVASDEAETKLYEMGERGDVDAGGRIMREFHARELQELLDANPHWLFPQS